MASTTTQIQIANRALQLLGQEAISSLQSNSRGARAIAVCYQPLLLKLLRANHWNFSIVRTILAPAATAPAFGPANYFPLPGDYLDLCGPDQASDTSFPTVAPPFSLNNANNTFENTNFYDWKIENMGNGEQAIISDASPPLYVRYVTSNVTEANFDVYFAEVFACEIALNICEQLTNSTAKFGMIKALRDEALEEGKKRNAYETKPIKPPMDSFLTVRF